MTHAYLEDLLRTVGGACFPNADEHTLDSVPPAGIGNRGRAEKFSLGKLRQHMGKSVEEMIRESVSYHLEHRSFNSVTEIISFLEDLGMSPQEKDWESDLTAMCQKTGATKKGTLADLDEMIRRRHNIVHRADKNTSGDGLQSIAPDHLLVWLQTTSAFMVVVTQACLDRQHTSEQWLEIFKARVRNQEQSKLSGL